MIESVAVEERAKRMRAAIEQRLATLEKTNSIKIFPFVNHTEDLVREYIPEGTSFEDAEAILRAAGFAVSPRPSHDVPGTRMDRYDVFGSVLLRQQMIEKVECLISMSPKAPGDYSVVDQISSVITAICL